MFATPLDLYNFLVNETSYKLHGTRLQSIDEILRSRKLDCWEAVEFAKFYLKQMQSVKHVKPIFIAFYGFENNMLYPAISHTATFFEYKSSKYYMEASWRQYAGLYQFNSWGYAILEFLNLFETYSYPSNEDIEKYNIQKLMMIMYGDVPPKATEKEFYDVISKGKLLYEKDI